MRLRNRWSVWFTTTAKPSMGDRALWFALGFFFASLAYAVAWIVSVYA